jgi:hypothetical protein
LFVIVRNSPVYLLSPVDALSGASGWIFFSFSSIVIVAKSPQSKKGTMSDSTLLEEPCWTIPFQTRVARMPCRTTGYAAKFAPVDSLAQYLAPATVRIVVVVSEPTSFSAAAPGKAMIRLRLLAFFGAAWGWDFAEIFGMNRDRLLSLVFFERKDDDGDKGSDPIL